MVGCHIAGPVNPSQFDLNFDFQTSDLVLQLVKFTENVLLGQIL
jgi:hypothetical protein